ncbi:hypothetical protein RF11_04667 [Thelohanellus kitauei]|uniref:Uncharacterized protein n=1 Tax=Thelohanellus kitauei TaxID=669202 RepID=A0A0C2ISH6_THEKT|nr:hypothetical protein RF11_04667 [Thelohanellus kitauei]
MRIFSKNYVLRFEHLLPSPPVIVEMKGVATFLKNLFRQNMFSFGETPFEKGYMILMMALFESSNMDQRHVLLILMDGRMLSPSIGSSQLRYRILIYLGSWGDYYSGSLGYACAQGDTHNNRR